MPERRKDTETQEHEAAHDDERVEDPEGDGEPGQAMEQAIVGALLGPLHDPRWSIPELEGEFGDQLLGFAQALNSLKEAEVVQIHGELVTLTEAARRMAELHER